MRLLTILAWAVALLGLATVLVAERRRRRAAADVLARRRAATLAPASPVPPSLPVSTRGAGRTCPVCGIPMTATERTWGACYEHVVPSGAGPAPVLIGTADDVRAAVIERTFRTGTPHLATELAPGIWRLDRGAGPMPARQAPGGHHA